jgi:hypothetical protein
MYFDDEMDYTRAAKKNAANKTRKANTNTKNALRELRRLNPVEMAYSNNADEFDKLLG